ncbi:MAG TPA: hypothetical protein VHG89_13500 [Verrucomicrobiae bacterium]|nr:hypothetical protein [Verrucomicrobiae bacterium]
MKIRPSNLFWLAVLLLVVGGFIYAAIPSRPDYRAKAAVAATRELLRRQGFKTDLADFDFSTPPEMRARETILKSTVSTNRFAEPFHDHPNLMEIVVTNSAVVVWKEGALKRSNPSWPDNGEMTWNEFREVINTNQPEMDAACAAILSGPIAFNLKAKAGNAMLLPHLALLKNLTQAFGDRMILALHDGDKNSVFTNLLAATRLVTAWNPEPAEISHLVRFGDAKIVFDETWQALQTNNWPDDKLAQLQTEWESVNFFTNLSETAAFRRASYVAACEQERREISDSRPPFNEFFNEALHYPLVVWSDLRYRWSREDYPRRGAYNDETNLLIFYRDREIELRNAARAQTWAQMRGMPSATNRIFFQSKNHSRIQSMMNLHELSLGFQRQGGSLLSRAAETEAARRILITAIALERYRGKFGSYPETLAKLAPEFLKVIPPDFMDGQPLRYRLVDGHFILYSVGLNCVDDGGKFPTRPKNVEEWQIEMGGAKMIGSDILWPLPVSAGDVAALRRKERREQALQNMNRQQRESEEEWEQSPLRQSRVEKILATDWTPDTNMETFESKRVIELLGNEKISGTNESLLAELLTPRQVITGNEPEDLTFEVPIKYDAITNLGALVLLADADIEEPMSDSGAKMQDCIRATNNDCLLVWHTIFDPPGKHAIQVGLSLSSESGGEYFLKGPAVVVTTSNLCQFSLTSAHFDYELGADFQARLPESNGAYVAEMQTTNGALLKTITSNTTNGVIKLHWDLIDEHGQRFTNEFFNSVFHLTLPDSRRSQTLKGP